MSQKFPEKFQILVVVLHRNTGNSFWARVRHRIHMDGPHIITALYKMMCDFNPGQHCTVQYGFLRLYTNSYDPLISPFRGKLKLTPNLHQETPRKS